MPYQTASFRVPVYLCYKRIFFESISLAKAPKSQIKPMLICQKLFIAYNKWMLLITSGTHKTGISLNQVSHFLLDFRINDEKKNYLTTEQPSLRLTSKRVDYVFMPHHKTEFHFRAIRYCCQNQLVKLWFLAPRNKSKKSFQIGEVIHWLRICL